MSAASQQRLTLYRTPNHECSYLPAEQAGTVFVDPALPKSRGLYSVLATHGFRRSGTHVYRPQCESCSQCVPVRVPVSEFCTSRRHRRNHKANADLEVTWQPAEYREEYFALYERYLNMRHPDGSMANPSRHSFEDFLLCDWAETRFAVFRHAGELVAVAVADPVDDGLSAVYTFFEPTLRRRGLGTYALLWQIGEVARRGQSYLYLGYWIARSPKMAYKGDFLPQERLQGQYWSRYPAL